MSLTRVVDAFADHLAAEMSEAPANLGALLPENAGDLPAITISVRDIEQKVIGVGATPAASRRGSLPVGRAFDLADPTLTFPDGETVDLLTADRLSLHFPYVPVVAVDGAEVAALSAADLSVSIDATPLTVVDADPGSGEVVGVPALGEIRFGVPLPSTGTLQVDFFVGEWEAQTARYQGQLKVDAFAATGGETLALTADAEATLLAADGSSFPGLQTLRSLEVGPVGAAPTPQNARLRTLRYAFDFELEEPKLDTGGGIIGRVAVDSPFGSETFEIPVLTP